MVWIVDIDTLALRGDRHPYDWSRVGEDQPNIPVVTIARALVCHGNQVRYITGRMEQCRHATVTWLRRHVAATTQPADVWMRADGDLQPNQDLKRELYDEHIRGRLEVEGVIEQRADGVRMWRDELGLTVLQCADGN